MSLIFLANFLRHPLRNASVVPSSRAASAMILRGIDFSRMDVIVELGPGDGPITEEILRRCKSGTRVILIELESTYIPVLKEKFGNRVIIEQSCASKLGEILARHGIDHPDVIVSGLPFMPKPIMDKVVRAIKVQTDAGVLFRFFTYLPPIMRRKYRLLPISKRGFIAKNVPPLWVYGVN